MSALAKKKDRPDAPSIGKHELLGASSPFLTFLRLPFSLLFSGNPDPARPTFVRPPRSELFSQFVIERMSE